MTISINRFLKFVFGLALISITLFSAGTGASSVVLYALVGLPFVFSALFDWRPLERIYEKLSFSFSIVPELKAVTKK